MGLDSVLDMFILVGVFVCSFVCLLLREEHGHDTREKQAGLVNAILSNRLSMLNS